MSFDPEAIEKALFDRIEAKLPADTFRLITRKARPFSTVGPENQPALFLIPHGGSVAQDQAYGVMKYVLRYSVLVYTRSEDGPDPDPPPQTLLNSTWAAVDQALRADTPGKQQTLGGLVQNAWIEGEVAMGSGILDQQCFLEIPIVAVTGI